jgi:hypothetical protein
MGDDRLKSAYELAMERFKNKDAEGGVVQPPLSEAQKAAIAELRTVCQAKIAELEILYRSKLRSMFDPAERERAEEDYRRERDRLNRERDARIESVRETGTSGTSGQ